VKLPELRIGDLIAPVPIIQGGMSIRVSTSSLAVAVADCGAIGTIGGSGLPIEELVADIERARLQTAGLIAVNIMFAIKNFAEAVEASMRAGAHIVITGAGFSRDVFGLGKKHNVPVISIVSSPEAARLAERSGAAAIVVEATEAGGHLGTERPLRELFPEVRKVISKVPLIAAGGLTDGHDIAEMMNHHGADGVQIATRFVLTEECDVHPSFKQAYLQASAEDVVLMQSPVGLPGRALRNRFIERLEAGEALHNGRCQSDCLKKCSRSFCINDRLIMARDGDVDEGLVFTGSNVWKCEGIPPVREVIDRLVSEAQEDLGRQR
jgi:NAD(P)H-dependent flavin oxidoreductase YrpB (nitropropane dioxygenase family)